MPEGLPPLLQRMRQRVAAWRPGIALQLGIGFLGVAVLAAVANFAVQRTISITTTRVLTSEAAATQGRGWSPRLPQVTAANDTSLSGAMGLPALERMSAAVESARLSPAVDREARVRAAAGELRAVLRRLHGSGERADAPLRTGVRLITLDAERDAAYLDYEGAMLRAEQRVQAVLDQAWRIFGRVVARQSLVVADQRIAELRRQSELLRTERYTDLQLAELEAAEARFAEALAAGERNFARSQGADWLVETRDGFEQLRAQRARIVAMDRQRRELLPRFRLELAATRSALLSPPSVSARPAAEPPGEAVRRLLMQPPPWKSPQAVTTRHQQQTDEGIDATGLAWLSAGVLVLLLAISVLTMRSILVPVRRLIGATQRIAQGEPGVRVPAGGSRELDRLASAFNQMATGLETARALARDYQQRLEARVAERTRQLQHLADHDVLTQLPNRRQLFERLRGMLEAGGDRAVALFFIDLDNFKHINDGRGHGFGDCVLVAIAERLRQTVGERGLLARFGGDEFTVVMQQDDDGSLVDMGRSLVRAFQRPLHIEGRELLVSVSVGAAFHPEHAGDAESLLRAADAALFHAKSLGRSQMAVYTPALLEAAATRFSIEQDLRHAVERGEFELHFQPELDLATGEVEVCEALVRWRKPGGELVAPAEFLAVAEDSGLIVDINEWVLRTAIATAARWRRGGLPALRVAVNASSRQFAGPAFAERVGALLAEHGLPPSALEFELTETVLQTGSATMAGLKRLQDLGVTVALDDFGTGYSSLASLEQLPLQRVKLDRSLVAGIDSGGRAATIAHAIIKLCHGLGVEVTAEGVERPAQLAMLRGAGVMVQGYLLARPVAESQLAATVARLPAALEGLLRAAGEGASVLADVVHLEEQDLYRRRRQRASRRD